MEDNYMRLFKEIRKDLGKWKKLELSLLGRTVTIKMNVLPQMFLFQAIPIILKNELFVELNKILNKFVWMGGKPELN